MVNDTSPYFSSCKWARIMTVNVIIIIPCRFIYYIDPRGRPTVTASSDHCFCICRPFVRLSVPTFQNKTNSKRKKCLLLARRWVWPSGSLKTSVLSLFGFACYLFLLAVAPLSNIMVTTDYYIVLVTGFLIIIPYLFLATKDI